MFVSLMHSEVKVFFVVVSRDPRMPEGGTFVGPVEYSRNKVQFKQFMLKYIDRTTLIIIRVVGLLKQRVLMLGKAEGTSARSSRMYQISGNNACV